MYRRSFHVILGLLSRIKFQEVYQFLELSLITCRCTLIINLNMRFAAAGLKTSELKHSEYTNQFRSYLLFSLFVHNSVFIACNNYMLRFVQLSNCQKQYETDSHQDKCGYELITVIN
jgi:hypothetical protein